jgi:hypothetical protein
VKMKILRIRQWLRGERDLVAATTATITDNIAALAEVAGMLLLPLVPAILTGFSMYVALLRNPEWPQWAANVVAIVVAVGLESLGIAASKTAMRLYRAWRDKLSKKEELFAVIGTTLLYVALVTAIIGFGEGLPPGITRWVGYASPLLAVSMYVVVGFNADIQDRRDRKRESTDFEQNLTNELKIAELEDKKARLDLKRDQEMLKFRQKLELNKLKRERILADSQGHLNLSPAQRKIEARKLLSQDPTISGAQLARYFGLSERSGQMLLKELRT